MTDPTVKKVTDGMEADRRWIVQAAFGLLGVALTAVASGVGSYYLFQSSSTNALLARIQHLENLTNELQSEVSRLNAENAVLQLRLEAGFSESPELVISNFLDALPRPAWCKYYDSENAVFRGLHFNPQYEFIHGVSNERYRGSTDVEIWGEEKGLIYQRNDIRTYHNRGSMVFTEPVLTAAGIEQQEFWKFYLRTRTGLDLVCGIQVTE